LQVGMGDQVSNLCAPFGEHSKNIVIRSGAHPKEGFQRIASRGQPRIASQLLSMLQHHLWMTFIRKARGQAHYLVTQASTGHKFLLDLAIEHANIRASAGRSSNRQIKPDDAPICPAVGFFPRLACVIVPQFL